MACAGIVLSYAKIPSSLVKTQGINVLITAGQTSRHRAMRVGFGKPLQNPGGISKIQEQGFQEFMDSTLLHEFSHCYLISRKFHDFSQGFCCQPVYNMINTCVHMLLKYAYLDSCY